MYRGRSTRQQNRSNTSTERTSECSAAAHPSTRSISCDISRSRSAATALARSSTTRRSAADVPPGGEAPPPCAASSCSTWPSASPRGSSSSGGSEAMSEAMPMGAPDDSDRAMVRASPGLTASGASRPLMDIGALEVSPLPAPTGTGEAAAAAAAWAQRSSSQGCLTSSMPRRAASARARCWSGPTHWPPRSSASSRRAPPASATAAGTSLVGVHLAGEAAAPESSCTRGSLVAAACARSLPSGSACVRPPTRSRACAIHVNGHVCGED